MLLAALVAALVLAAAPAAFVQEGGACPAGEASVLGEDGQYTCVPGNVDDQTPEQIEAVTNDPRSNAETPIVENQPVDGVSSTPEARQYAPNNATGAGQYVVGADDGVCVGPGEVDPDCAEALRESLEGQDPTPPGTIQPGTRESCEGIADQADFEACAAQYEPRADGEPPAIEQQYGAGEVACENFVSAAGNPSQLLAQQFYDFNATAEEQAALDADGDGFACDDLETGVDALGETDEDRAAENGQGDGPAEPRAPGERAEDPCKDRGFAEEFAGLPVRDVPGDDARGADPEGTGVVCGHVLAEHGYVPLARDADPDGEETLPLTGGVPLAPQSTR
jgi:hypothetical protein